MSDLAAAEVFSPTGTACPGEDNWDRQEENGPGTGLH